MCSFYDRLLIIARLMSWCQSQSSLLHGGTTCPGETTLSLGASGRFAGQRRLANEFYQDLRIYSGFEFAVLGGNIRGSSGYGDPFIRALIGEVSRGEDDDVMSGVDHIINLGIADPERLAVRGWSWRIVELRACQ